MRTSKIWGKGIGSMQIPADKGEGVKIGQNLAGVFYGWPLAPYQKGTSQESTCHSISKFYV